MVHGVRAETREEDSEGAAHVHKNEEDQIHTVIQGYTSDIN